MNAPEGPAAPASGITDDPEILALLDFDPVPMRKRVNGWDADAQRAFVALVATTGSKLLAARAIGRKASGLDRIFERDDATAFGEAFDAAMLLFRQRSGQLLGKGVAAAARTQAERSARVHPSAPLPGQVVNEHGEYEDEASYRRRAEEAKDSIGTKLVRCRRLFLQEISGDAGKRAAFEILTELPVDWELAAKLEPQPFEPWTRTNQREPDMVLTAESGWSFGEGGYGPDKKAAARAALDQWREEQGLEPIAWGAE